MPTYTLFLGTAHDSVPGFALDLAPAHIYLLLVRVPVVAQVLSLAIISSSMLVPARCL